MLNEQISKAENIVLFGQNITAGSCISGLTRDLEVPETGLMINTPNSENTLVGIGFGLMLKGVSSVFFMKQLDFLLLGIDHLVNTYNFIRINKPKASFTILPVIVDQGFQGMQSSLNNLADFCSIARIPGYTITNKHDAEKILTTQLINPGFRIIGVSQRLFNQELMECEQLLHHDDNGQIFQYAKGKDVTIVCFNFSFPQGLKLYRELKESDLESSFFTVNSVTPVDWDMIIEDVSQTKNIIVIDDSKSQNRSCYHFLMHLSDKCKVDNKIVIEREISIKCFYPNHEALEVSSDDIIGKLKKNIERSLG